MIWSNTKKNYEKVRKNKYGDLLFSINALKIHKENPVSIFFFVISQFFSLETHLFYIVDIGSFAQTIAEGNQSERYGDSYLESI